MTAQRSLKALLLWLLILACAIANGALREGVLLQHLQRSTAFPVSGLLLIACILAVTLATIRWLGCATGRQCLLVGLLWLGLTLAFEFGFGIYVRGKSLEALLDAYRFRDGDLWPVVLVVVALAPWFANAVRRGPGAPGRARQDLS